MTTAGDSLENALQASKERRFSTQIEDKHNVSFLLTVRVMLDHKKECGDTTYLMERGRPSESPRWESNKCI